MSSTDTAILLSQPQSVAGGRSRAGLRDHSPGAGGTPDLSPRPQTNLNRTRSPATTEQDGMEVDTSPMNLHIDVKSGVTPLDALNPAHVAAAAAERLHNGLRDAEADDKTGLIMAAIPRTVAAAEDKGHPERKRRASNDSLDSSTKASESAADDGKDDDDENDDDDEEKLQAQDIDPERLKAFNMFVRLFVDENLDRMVPISKQPKDKVQAILEACDRQFPEFHDRARKRVRTYLKSCRRLRRSKDSNGWEQMRPTPPHLTSAAAETILALACENEGNNAKRMRMGLEPLPQARALTGASSPPSQSQPAGTSPPMSNTTTSSATSTPTSHSSTTGTGVQTSSGAGHTHPSPLAPTHLAATDSNSRDYLRSSTASHTPTAFRPPHELPSPFFANGNGLFRPGFPSYQHPAHHSPVSVSHAHISHSTQNGPTDLSMKKGSSGGIVSKNQQLNPTEVATIKQLIAGYRESAAFLYRSADELEQLLLHHN